MIYRNNLNSIPKPKSLYGTNLRNLAINITIVSSMFSSQAPLLFDFRFDKAFQILSNYLGHFIYRINDKMKSHQYINLSLDFGRLKIWDIWEVRRRHLVKK